MANSVAKVADPLRRWTVNDAKELYGVAHWGSRYFSINSAGNVTVASGQGTPKVDLKELVDDLAARGIQTPVLIRFTDLLQARIRLLNEAFANAIRAYDYPEQYRGVYPIKVNQSRMVVEQIIEFGKPYHYGLEAGSKPELLAVMALHEDPQALIVCNGYKDEEYIRTALLASTLGRTVVIVVEKPGELTLIHKVAKAMNVTPSIGIRLRLSSRGSGKWEQSGGDRSKFGLTAAELLDAVDFMREAGTLDCFKLLHFHLGSQISAIRSVKDAMREAGRFYVELHRKGCTGLAYFDVGGGLGVDYDGSQTNFHSSMNYTVQEYANDVVGALSEMCIEEEVPHPTIVSESGRAVVAHHAVLVVDVLGVNEFGRGDVPDEIPEDAHALAHNLHETFHAVSRKNLLESYHDAVDYKDQTLQLFNLGHLSLEMRVQCERMFWAICHKILGIVRTLSRVHDDLKGIEKQLSDTYFCNFSMFQSLPDAWAVDQLFPIMPIHRLLEEPTNRAILADITCDSDGQISDFIDIRDVKATLELHRPNGQPYHLGMFLSGAYQEILGDLHNLFGDTNTVQVVIHEDGSYTIDDVLMGDTVTDALRYVGYAPEDLLKKLRRTVEIRVKEQRMSLEDSRQLIQQFRDGLASYTYLANS